MPIKQWLKRLSLVASAAVTLWACGDDARQTATIIAADEIGPYAIGYDDWRFSYDAIGEENREIRVAIWYPTAAPNDQAPTYFNLFPRQGISQGAPPYNSPTSPPVLIYSHGNEGFAETSAFLCEHFASHGWLVLAPDHSGNTFSLTGSETASDSPIWALRPQDIQQVIAELQGGNFENLPGDYAAAETVVLAGYSFGGATGFLLNGATLDADAVDSACASGQRDDSICDAFANTDTRNYLLGENIRQQVDLFIPIAAGGHQLFASYQDLTAPVLLVTGAMDQAVPNAAQGDLIWRDLSGDHVRLDLKEGGHATYTNLCGWLGDLDPRLTDDGCSDAFINPEVAHQLLEGYLLAYSRYRAQNIDASFKTVERLQSRYSDIANFSQKSP